MGKNTKVLFILLLVGLTLTSGCTSYKKAEDITKKAAAAATAETKTNETKTDEVKYKDGDYEVKTDPDSEGFYCKAKVSIKDNKFTSVEWDIYDMNNRVFDETYEEVYKGQPTYQQQCRNDLKGLKAYGPKLLEVQNIKEVDAISGATWTNKYFKKVVNLALKKAMM